MIARLDEETDILPLAEWAGGSDAMTSLFTRFDEHGAADARLAPVFAAMNPHHAEHVALFASSMRVGSRLGFCLSDGH